MLLDEPLGALDLKLREHMKIELKQLQWGTFNTTFAYITHDQSEALVMSDRIAAMNQGPVRAGGGSPRELYHSPATPFVASFVGETNRWQGQAASAADGAVAVRLASGAVVQGQGSGAAQALAFVRPEAVALAQDQSSLASLPNRFEGRVSAVLFDGAASSLSSTRRASTSPCAPCCPRPGRSRASRSARRSMWAGRRMR